MEVVPIRDVQIRQHAIMIPTQRAMIKVVPTLGAPPLWLATTTLRQLVMMVLVNTAHVVDAWRLLHATTTHWRPLRTDLVNTAHAQGAPMSLQLTTTAMPHWMMGPAPLTKAVQMIRALTT